MDSTVVQVDHYGKIVYKDEAKWWVELRVVGCGYIAMKGISTDDG